jgi:hypothetical protein
LYESQNRPNQSLVGVPKAEGSIMKDKVKAKLASASGG